MVLSPPAVAVRASKRLASASSSGNGQFRIKRPLRTRRQNRKTNQEKAQGPTLPLAPLPFSLDPSHLTPPLLGGCRHQWETPRQQRSEPGLLCLMLSLPDASAFCTMQKISPALV